MPTFNTATCEHHVRVRRLRNTCAARQRTVQMNARSAVIVCTEGTCWITRSMDSMLKLRFSSPGARAHPRPRAGSDGQKPCKRQWGKLWDFAVYRGPSYIQTLRSGPNVKILASQKLNVVLVNVKTAVSCLNKVIFARSLRSRAYCSSVNTVQNPNSVPALTFGCSTSTHVPVVSASRSGQRWRRLAWQAARTSVRRIRRHCHGG